MRAFFCRQLSFYARYHRSERNCVTHYLGIPMLFLAVILPLEAVRISFGDATIPLGLLLTAPAAIGWVVLDPLVGGVLAVFLGILIVVAELIVRTGDRPVLWGCAAVLFVAGWFLQFVGHAVFERRRPAFADDVSQTLIGPMFVVAKLLVALGLRSDLAVAMGHDGATTERRRLPG